ncbi:single-stranded DNA-binding protein [Enterobacter phage Entb_43]|uniref:Single-stranded DNA-binding protein n=2 Tax=Karamvirus TaxID=1913650 RepID=A0A5B9NI24_9CAUD|nr:single strand DNA binding protein [Enterobacter phage CC31]QEG13309.1 putative ssDNA binding protein [Klebsiella phage vB_KaeM_KaAlpha]URQ04049.1 single stranded DNA-binding protein [Enterobacter phage vB_EclM-UFV01]USL85748.1 single-stranded DNA-binding protein [Enterobacter phage fGh-Ecl01]USL86228.1 single-stranded DNA-binding protein [Enterobacter phage fGh-Ecl04]UVD32644.1 single-stranded DNA-binding protein [Enterobacter phage Entb_43]
MFKRKNPAALASQLASLSGSKGFNSEDKGEWKLKLDNAGNGQAVIRFLPGKGDEGVPFAVLVNHGFKKGGKWYIENCTSTHGDYDSCPVCQYLSKNDSYNTNNEEYKLLKRKTSYYANILVVKDPAAPENEGKVFKYRFGKKIWDKINAMVAVDVEMGETPIDVTCAFEGANFVLKVKKVSGFSNYDESKFLGQSEIPNIEDEAYQAQLQEQMVDLTTLTAKDQFKSFEDNQKKFLQVMGTAAMGTAASRASAQADKVGEDLDNFEDDLANFNAGSQKSAPAEDFMETGGSASSGDEDLDELLNGL